MTPFHEGCPGQLAAAAADVDGGWRHSLTELRGPPPFAVAVLDDAGKGIRTTGRTRG